MSEPEDQAYLLEEVINRLNNLVRIGQIAEVNEHGRVKVKIGGITTDWLDVLQNKAGKSIKKYSPPCVLETVVIISPMGDLEQGFVLPGLYTDSNKPPNKAYDKEVSKFGDEKVFLTLSYGSGTYGVENQKGSLITAIAEAFKALTKGEVDKKPILNETGLPIAKDPSFKEALEAIESFVETKSSEA